MELVSLHPAAEKERLGVRFHARSGRKRTRRVDDAGSGAGTDFMDAETPKNAAAVVAASGRATNEALHLPAMAHEYAITFDLFDVAEVFKRTSYTAHLKPSGRYVAKDLFEGGFMPLLMKSLRDQGFLHGDCMVVTGRSVVGDIAVSTIRRMDHALLVIPRHHLQALSADRGTLEIRRADWRPHACAFASGSICKYAQQVGPARHGAVNHPGAAVEKSCYADI